MFLYLINLKFEKYQITIYSMNIQYIFYLILGIFLYRILIYVLKRSKR
jgi:hypothetical protein